MIIVYTGRGKGKTSSGIATAIRSMIAGKKVGYIQFMKSEGNDASKLSSYFPELDFYSFGTKAFVDPKNISEDAKKEAESGWNKALDFFKTKDLIVLDELNVVLAFKILDENLVLKELEKYKMNKIDKPTHYSWPIIVLTGIDCPEKLIELADLVTEMKQIKHPYYSGYLATKGIDF